LGEGAVDNLIDGVDRFLLAGAATKNEYLRDEVILRVVRIVAEMRRGLPLRNHFWDAYWLAATAAADIGKTPWTKSGRG
jgi:hypothetical protein